MQPLASEGRNRVISNDRDPSLVDLYTVRPDGGGKELLAENESTGKWIIESMAYRARREFKRRKPSVGRSSKSVFRSVLGSGWARRFVIPRDGL